jgi:hypothetical protein
LISTDSPKKNASTNNLTAAPKAEPESEKVEREREREKERK